MEEEHNIEQRFKMRAINSINNINNINILKEVKLFENVFDNSDVAEFDESTNNEEDKHQLNRDNYVN